MENARLQHDFNISQLISTNLMINDQNRECNTASDSERGAEIQPRSITSDFESIPSLENKDCEYLKLVMAFKRTLVLPDVFFSYDMAVCYCTACLSSGRNLIEGKFEHLFFNFDFNTYSLIKYFIQIVISIRLGTIQIESYGNKY